MRKHVWMFAGSFRVVAGLILCVALAGCADDPQRSLSNHPEFRAGAHKIGVISDLGDGLSFEASRGSAGPAVEAIDISDWHVDDAVVQSAQNAVSSSRSLIVLKVSPGTFDDISDVTLARAARDKNVGCAAMVTGMVSMLGGVVVGRPTSCDYDNPRFISRPDPVALQTKISRVLGQRNDGVDVWLIVRKGLGRPLAAERDAHKGVTFLAIGAVGESALLHVLARVTIVDGKTLAPLADVELLMPTPSDDPNMARMMITPVQDMGPSFALTSWQGLTVAQHEQIRAALGQMLTSAVTATVHDLGLSMDIDDGQVGTVSVVKADVQPMVAIQPSTAVVPIPSPPPSSRDGAGIPSSTQSLIDQMMH